MTETQKPLNRAEAIAALSKAYGIDLAKLAKGIRVKTECHEGNPFAPELYCYKITYSLWGQKSRLAFWPNTVGYQGY